MVQYQEFQMQTTIPESSLQNSLEDSIDIQIFRNVESAPETLQKSPSISQQEDDQIMKEIQDFQEIENKLENTILLEEQHNPNCLTSLEPPIQRLGTDDKPNSRSAKYRSERNLIQKASHKLEQKDEQDDPNLFTIHEKDTKRINNIEADQFTIHHNENYGNRDVSAKSKGRETSEGTNPSRWQPIGEWNPREKTNANETPKFKNKKLVVNQFNEIKQTEMHFLGSSSPKSSIEHNNHFAGSFAASLQSEISFKASENSQFPITVRKRPSQMKGQQPSDSIKVNNGMLHSKRQSKSKYLAGGPERRRVYNRGRDSAEKSKSKSNSSHSNPRMLSNQYRKLPQKEARTTKNTLVSNPDESNKDDIIQASKSINKGSFRGFGDYVRSQIKNEYGVSLPDNGKKETSISSPQAKISIEEAAFSQDSNNSLMMGSKQESSPETAKQTSRLKLFQDSITSSNKPKTTRNNQREMLNISEDFNGRHFLIKQDEREESPTENYSQYLDKDNSIALLQNMARQCSKEFNRNHKANLPKGIDQTSPKGIGGHPLSKKDINIIRMTKNWQVSDAIATSKNNDKKEKFFPEIDSINKKEEFMISSAVKMYKSRQGQTQAGTLQEFKKQTDPLFNPKVNELRSPRRQTEIQKEKLIKDTFGQTFFRNQQDEANQRILENKNETLNLLLKKAPGKPNLTSVAEANKVELERQKYFLSQSQIQKTTRAEGKRHSQVIGNRPQDSTIFRSSFDNTVIFRRRQLLKEAREQKLSEFSSVSNNNVFVNRSKLQSRPRASMESQIKEEGGNADILIYQKMRNKATTFAEQLFEERMFYEKFNNRNEHRKSQERPRYSREIIKSRQNPREGIASGYTSQLASDLREGANLSPDLVEIQ